MVTAVLDLGAAVRGLRLDAHLPECRHASRTVVDCDWCLWALDVPQVRSLLDVAADVRALTEVGAGAGTGPAGARDTVPWVLAAAQVAAHRTQVVVDEVVVPSVRSAVARLADAVDAELAGLDRLVDVAVAPGGPVEQRCLRTAGALAATRLGRPEYAGLLAAAPPGVRRSVTEVAGLLSGESQAESVVPVVDATHWRGLPPLRTQPEWALRPPAGHGMRHPGPQRQVAPSRGSLEALVVESLADRVSDQLLAVSGDLARIGPPVDLVRSDAEPRRTARGRNSLFRMALIDWHLSLVDSGRASCWPGRAVDGGTAVTVPWVVAAAVDVLRGVAVSTVHVTDPPGFDLVSPFR